MKTDPSWEKVRKNPPADWREVWQNRAKLGRYDTEAQAIKAIGKVKAELNQNVWIDIHPKDGFVVFAEYKRLADWKGQLGQYLQVGDLVDNELEEYFINTLPPETYNSRFIQMGEPYSTINGKLTYATLKKTSYGWAYAGHYHAGGEQPSLTVKYIGEDDWGRKTYKRVDTGAIYKLVNDWYHTCTSYGEPECSIKREFNVIVQEQEQV